MVTEESRVKVLDFGLAKLAEAVRGDEDVTALQNTQLTSEGRIVGTVAYMSPEQADGKRLDARSDVFSLGVMLHEMATGEHPFKGGSALSTITRVIRDTPPAITEIRPSLPRDLAVIVRRCLVKDPEFRTQTAKDLRNQLDDLKNEAHSRSDSGIAAVSSKPPRKFQPLWMTLAFAGVLAGVAGTVRDYQWIETRHERAAGHHRSIAADTRRELLRVAFMVAGRDRRRVCLEPEWQLRHLCPPRGRGTGGQRHPGSGAGLSARHFTGRQLHRLRLHAEFANWLDQSGIDVRRCRILYDWGRHLDRTDVRRPGAAARCERKCSRVASGRTACLGTSPALNCIARLWRSKSRPAPHIPCWRARPLNGRSIACGNRRPERG